MPNYLFSLINEAGRTVRRIEVQCKDDDQALAETMQYTPSIASIDIRRLSGRAARQPFRR
jgi:hypothetical protein